MAKLRVRRKSYIRKAYTRKDGTRVKASRVPSSSFRIKDRGKKGRTPKSGQFYHPKVKTGWEAGMPMEERRRKVLGAHKGDALASGRGMIALSNVQHRINPDVAKKARSDADYFFRMHQKKGK